MSEIDNSNPYDIIDGYWGGMGIQKWFRDQEGLPPENVYELDRNQIDDKPYYQDNWGRVWDAKLEQWRSITDKELEILPKFDVTPYHVVNFDKIMIPKINRTFPKL